MIIRIFFLILENIFQNVFLIWYNPSLGSYDPKLQGVPNHFAKVKIQKRIQNVNKI